jgi:hypothetical protein
MSGAYISWFHIFLSRLCINSRKYNAEFDMIYFLAQWGLGDSNGWFFWGGQQKRLPD